MINIPILVNYYNSVILHSNSFRFIFDKITISESSCVNDKVIVTYWSGANKIAQVFKQTTVYSS